MPAALRIFGVQSLSLPRPRVLFIASAALFILAALWSVADAGSATPDITPLYPQAPASVPVVDMSNHTLMETLNQIPELSRYALLVYNGGVAGELAGAAHTIYVPASNYIDYLPRGAIAHLTHAQMRELAVAQMTSQPPQGARVFREYDTKNGVIYVTDKVVVPDDLKAELQ